MYNFTLQEFEKSDISKKKGYDNRVKTFDVLDNLVNLVKYLLQPLRNKINKPVIITSGFRCHDLNCDDDVGGVWNSQHLIGKASDIYVKGYTPYELYTFILFQNLPFDQIVIYDDKLHVSYNHGFNRKSVIDKRKDKKNG